MQPDPTAFLASLREWASDPLALAFALTGKHGTISILPEDVTTRTDEELLAFVRGRCDE